MLKYGIVKEVDVAKVQARVEFGEDELVSHWLPILQRNTKVNKEYSLVDVGEHVAVLTDENVEEGIILGAHYNDVTPDNGSNSTADFSKVSYGNTIDILFNRQAGTYSIMIKDGSGKSFTLDVSGGASKLVVNADGFKITGNAIFDNDVTISGNLTVEGDLIVNSAILCSNITASGDITTDGKVDAQGDVKAGPIGARVSLLNHFHPTPAGPSSPPTPTP